MRKILAKTWKDPVGIKVIATGIIALISSSSFYLFSYLKNITFKQAFQQLLDIVNLPLIIPLWSVLAILCVLILMAKYFLLKSTKKTERELNENDQKVINALLNPKYTFRYLGGIAKESGIQKKEALSTLNWLLENNFGKFTEGEHGRLWSLTAKGKEAFKIT
ncbi:hypothetical protein FCL47_23320 [Desulfopila sp. IMCC35006]|uniref:hypothetical protein n=1 Tax=Desulfopila sp. IMCC35006 TaxID=2569542 RepID=UPI0010ABB4AB|nr:hypothetical protein [Desulfopila sp. IMCC35006]TKB23291.1 hypothetical protein FCL47_23320 [Desulfopila sp. IMCC35006]